MLSLGDEMDAASRAAEIANSTLWDDIYDLYLDIRRGWLGKRDAREEGTAGADDGQMGADLAEAEQKAMAQAALQFRHEFGEEEADHSEQEIGETIRLRREWIEGNSETQDLLPVIDFINEEVSGKGLTSLYNESFEGTIFTSDEFNSVVNSNRIIREFKEARGQAELHRVEVLKGVGPMLLVLNERRLDESQGDGEYYSRSDFIHNYGVDEGLRLWNEAVDPPPALEGSPPPVLEESPQVLEESPQVLEESPQPYDFRSLYIYPEPNSSQYSTKEGYISKVDEFEAAQIAVIDEFLRLIKIVLEYIILLRVLYFSWTTTEGVGGGIKSKLKSKKRKSKKRKSKKRRRSSRKYKSKKRKSKKSKSKRKYTKRRR